MKGEPMQVIRERILVVDDDENTLALFESVLSKEGYAVVCASSGEEALHLLTGQEFDLMISDWKLPPGMMDGIELLRQVKTVYPTLSYILMTGHGSVPSAVAAMKEGATDYLTKPVNMDELKLVVEKALEVCRLSREVERLREQLASEEPTFPGLIARSKAMRALLRQVKLVAASDTTVLLQGESGTGKELVARAIHDHSPRRERPFVVIDCGTVPESLLETELFGHVKGAFTGAATTKKGLFEEAHGGTLFLDEIGDITPLFQAKLLRVLQTREIRPVGSTKRLTIDVRVIAATNKDLKKLVAERQFRDDLYYRLAVVPLYFPLLRDRHEDIPLLAEHFVRQSCERNNLPLKRISPAVLRLLMAAPWPGNVRELEHTIERAVLLSPGPEIQPQGLLFGSSAGEGMRLPTSAGLSHARAVLDGAEREKLQVALEQTRGNRSRAAKLLGISRSTLYERHKRYAFNSGP
ncbi:MAG TPA: sigma-54 dependent transcriptional regulator [Candidatus Binatia bacterium]|nr:sigma-54 dependent transcriptional regulator [Candidatus Binatia bacterium]